MISVDGDTSTNDTVLLLANGLAENEEIIYGSEDYNKFVEALHEINEYLASTSTPAISLSIGICFPITPVEPRSTPSFDIPSISAAAFAVSSQ